MADLTRKGKHSSFKSLNARFAKSQSCLYFRRSTFWETLGLCGFIVFPNLAFSFRKQAPNVVIVENNDQCWYDHHKDHLRQANFADECRIKLSDNEKKNATENRCQAANDRAQRYEARNRYSAESSYRCN